MSQILVVEPSAGNHRGESSIGNRSIDQAKRTQSEEASSTSENRRLANSDTHRWITQNCRQCKYGHDLDDLCNIIDDRCIRAMKSSPPQRSPVRAPTPLGRAAFRALAPELRQVAWPYKFNLGSIDKYDGSSNPEEFIKLYRTVIEVIGGDDQVKANYLPTALSDAARSWLINLLEGTIYKWDQLYIVFIGSFQGTYKHPSTAETLKTIK
jgi:hypothetical protein